MSVLSRACSDFLLGMIDLGNCLSLLALAEAYGSDSLLQSAMDFVIQNFQDLSNTQDFLDMQVPADHKPTLTLTFPVHQTWALIITQY